MVACLQHRCEGQGRGQASEGGGHCCKGDNAGKDRLGRKVSQGQGGAGE